MEQMTVVSFSLNDKLITCHFCSYYTPMSRACNGEVNTEHFAVTKLSYDMLKLSVLQS